MEYTKVVLTGVTDRPHTDLDKSALNPMFDVDLRLKKNGDNSCELVAVVKNFRHEKAINLDVSCNGAVYDYSNLEPFWDSFEIYLGDVVHTADGKYELANGLVFDSSYKPCDRLYIDVTSCGDGNTFKADVAGILSDAEKGMVTIH